MKTIKKQDMNVVLTFECCSQAPQLERSKLQGRLDWSGENEFRFKVGEGLGFRVGEVGRRGKLCGR
jgi:hypothetical protein